MPYLTISTSPSLRIFYLDQSPPNPPDPSTPPIFLIHGATCDHHDWSWQVPLLLSLGFRIITPDLRGHGKSSSPQPTTSITTWPGPDAITTTRTVDYYPQSMADDLLALLNHLSIPRAILLSHSLGTTIAYHLSATHPSRVAACITIDPYHNQPNSVRDPLVGAFETDANDVMWGWFEANVYDGVPTPGWQMAWHRARTLGMEEGVMRGLAWGAWEAGDSLGRMEVARGVLVDGMGRGEGVRCPVLVVGAREENVILEREMVKRNGLSEVRLVGDGGHWLHQVSKGEEFNGILREWLGKCGLIPGSESN